ncbi:hypothetical protein CNYM01_03359 [Colletotrichum nymphaeae SA-01]|uniref:Cytochrome P450 n=1 Tax=Colletotrichum nymphaeae SA-01 TaxID=1460502 RepID=A0A135TS09_9PEZI|nr:hypothetical protein CNYM01_03359 [Colletotrichum nymphaeae SA-01]
MYKVIYSQIDPFPKHAPFYAAFNAPHTAFTETDPAKHKTRRQMLSPSFSRAGALKLEPVIRQKLTTLDDKIERLLKEGDIDIYPAMRALTTEVIMQFAFGRSGGMIEENEHNFTSWFSDSLSVASHGFHTMLYNPLARHIGNCLPIPLVTFMKPDVGKILSLLKFASESVDYWKESGTDHVEVPVLFDRLTGISRSDMATEAVDMIVAGADTTAMSATVAIVEILTNPTIEGKLVQALDASIPSRDALPPLLELEKIEYLNACVKEAIRFTAAVPGRLPRVVPNGKKAFIVENKIIPPGFPVQTVVSMSAHTMHTSVDAWGPDARSFNPDRWLKPNAKSLEQYQVAFSKGARMCLGQNIAPAEITCVLALLFRKYAVTLARDFRPPRKVDVFTLEFEAPGVPIRFTPRS